MSSSDKVLAMYKWLTGQGFRPVAVHPDKKAAIDGEFTATAYTAPPIQLWSSASFNIGVVTGPAHSGPVDVDLDSPEAIFFAEQLMPHTGAIFGRKAKRKSHYLYKVSSDAFPRIVFNDPVAKDTLMELRGDGGYQTLMPGSIHPSEEIIEWELEGNEPDIAEITAGELKTAASRVAAASLIARHAWAEGQRNHVCLCLSGFMYHLEWELDDAEAFMRAIMEYTEDHDRSRLVTLRNTYRKAEKGANVTGLRTMRTYVGDEVADALLSWLGSERGLSNLIQSFNERYACVIIGGKFRIATVRRGIDGRPGYEFMVPGDLVNYTAHEVIEVDGKTIPAAKIWLKHPRRRQYESVCFEPGLTDDECLPNLNLWMGWGVSEKDDPSKCEAVLELLKTTICGGSDELYEWMLNWLAHLVQKPREKPGTSPVIIGPQGAGKSLFVSYIGRIIGAHYIVVTNEEHIYGKFNRHIMSSLLLHSEEALYAGDKRHKSIIKSLISDPYTMMEAKGVDAIQVRSHLRLIMTSNELYAAPAERDDRRFTVINMTDRVAPKDLIERVLDELNSDGPDALFHMLRNREVSGSMVRLNIKDDALRDLKTMNLEPIDEWWYRLLNDGQLFGDANAWAGRPTEEPWPEIFASPVLYDQMVDEMRKRGTRNIPSETSFWIHMNRLIGRDLVKKRLQFSTPMNDDQSGAVSVKRAVTNLPSLTECREAFENHIGQYVPWPESGDDEELDRPSFDEY